MTRDRWERIPLRELCDFQNGFAFKNSDYVQESDGAYPVFRMGNILKGGGFNSEANKVLVSRAQGEKLSRFLLNEGDILMCMTDMKANTALLGHTAWMPVSGRYLLNQRVGRVTVKRTDALDRGYLFYYSNSSEYRVVAFPREQRCAGESFHGGYPWFANCLSPTDVAT